MDPDQQSLPPRLHPHTDVGPSRVTGQLHMPARAQQRLEGLLRAVPAISRELEPPVVLQQIVSTAVELVGARYGAPAVLNRAQGHPRRC
ncbi:hypothetical protein ACFWOJ_32770 [Streptomyces sp. NPDC058439]|uniref:hypothetical protein n=1 Tax=Streptomyces sp. NPDC058439 TaxID=3346500 RepID=UPI00365033CC